MSKLTLQELESHLWKSADILRGSIDSSDYKSYIFGLLFIKRLSDVFTEHRNDLLEEHGVEIGEILAEDPEQFQFYVPQEARWHEIRKHAQDVGTAINVAFEALENENKTLEGVLTPIDFNRKEVLTDEVLQRLLQHFSLLDLSNSNLSEPDMLGRAYEYLISQFADDAGRKVASLHTFEIVELIVKLIKPKKACAYDPTCGSGGCIQAVIMCAKAVILNPFPCMDRRRT
jgi:type I restriction enzyme M protein